MPSSKASPCAVQTAFWPPIPSETSAFVNSCPGGGTGMNGALHAQSAATTPSAAARRAMRKRSRFFTMESPSPCQSKGQSSGRARKIGPAPGRSSTWLAARTTRLEPRRWAGSSCDQVPLQLLLHAEAREADQLAGLRLVVAGASQGFSDERTLEALDARLDRQAVEILGQHGAGLARRGDGRRQVGGT